MTKRILKVLVVMLLTAAAASAHTVNLSWTKSTDDTGATGSGYTVYRQSGTCPASITSTTGFTALNTALVSGSTFVDSTVTPGQYCYTATFTASAASSVPATPGATATILPAAPTGVTVTSSN